MASQVAINMAQRAREIAWDGNFPIDPVAIAEGITVVKRDADQELRLRIRMEGQLLDGLSGYAEYVEAEEGPHFNCVFNLAEQPTRQRFTQAHELGHVLLDHVSKGEIRRRDDATFKASAADWIETDANAFAAELIMPAKYVHHMASKITDIRKLAKEFGVSPWAIRYRLMNLGLL